MNLRALGQAIAATAKETGKKIAIVASGDMSHKLIPGAPAGYLRVNRDGAQVKLAYWNP